MAAHGVELDRQEIVSVSGRPLGTVPVGPLGDEIGRRGVGVRREDLLRTLLAGCAAVPIRYRARLTAVLQDADGVTAEFADGAAERGDVLVGADGIRSVVRRGLFDGRPAQALGHMIWRGISESDEGYPRETSLMVFGAAGERTVSWPVGGGRVCWSVSRNGGPALSPVVDPVGVKRMLLEYLSHFPSPLLGVLGTTPAARIMRTDLFGHFEDQWARGRVALLGDAAHAMPTVYGQGACQAIEDAVTLAEELSATADVEAALQGYAERRQPRVRWIRQRVFSLSRYQEWQLPVLTTLRDEAFTRIPANATVGTWRRLLTFDDRPAGAGEGAGHAA
ncbi:FAD-dependent monooxygenase [Amycolatopsis sp. A1MSW2902]|uniref:FAD-dependent monooxygenase n=1 Tax=Amycolatopsis sp. A1MSW2902 TaxID=687413 RepID=UPI00307CE2A0